MRTTALTILTATTALGLAAILTGTTEPQQLLGFTVMTISALIALIILKIDQ